MLPQLIFLGAPGSGKGTQAKILESHDNYIHLSTGDLLRSEIEKGSNIGLEVDRILKAGQLVGDSHVLELVRLNCDVKSNFYIFDGFPRNYNQALDLEKHILKDIDFKVLYFHIDSEILIDRIVNRRSCSSCGMVYNLKSFPPKNEGTCDSCGGGIITRNDDNPKVAKVRFKLFETSIFSMIEHYESIGNICRLDASAEAGDLAAKIQEVINN